MIFKDELKNAVKEYFKSLVDKELDMWDMLSINSDLQRIIDDLDSHMLNPVEESVPVDEKYVLLSFENYSGIDIGRYVEDENGGAFYPGDDDESYVSYGIFVNAWMELPERYNREQEKEKGY